MRQQWWHHWEGRPFAKVMGYYCERVFPVIMAGVLLYAVYSLFSGR